MRNNEFLLYIHEKIRSMLKVCNYSILARFLAMASSTALSSRRSSSLLEDVFAVFDFAEVAGSAGESTVRFSGLLVVCGVTDDETASFTATGASETGDGSRGRFFNADCLSLLLLGSDLDGGECWEGLEASVLSVRATDCNENKTIIHNASNTL